MNDVRLIAFYLPQFHPIEENDTWWGKGFTEWTNVASAKPVFPGHYQPHVPADLGFYDLRLAETREEQANLARRYGIEGFCYYYYYFNGKRLLNKPLDAVIASGKPDFPFCICWANENWTRKWDGRNDEILIKQVHSPEDDLEFIRQLVPALKDKRYIRVNNKLLLLVYRTELFPEPAITSAAWREFVRKELGEELYLCAVNNFIKEIDPALIGFDGVVQFPLTFNPGIHIDKKVFASVNGLDYQDIKDNWFLNYPSAVNHLVHVPKPAYKFFRGVFPSWDNTPRRQQASSVFVNSTPEFYKLYLKTVIGLTRAEHAGDERLIFINAWNEWAEGAHLEPDKMYGLQLLEATREATAENGDYTVLMEEIKEKDAVSRSAFSSTGPLTENVATDEETQKQVEQKHQQQIALIEKKHYDTVMSLIRSYEGQLKTKQLLYEGKLGDSDALLHETANKLEKQLKSSWTWRIGWAQTSAVVLSINFLRNPYKFLINKRYRWKDLYYFDDPVSEQQKPLPVARISKDSGQQNEAVVVESPDPGKLTLMCVFDTFTRSCFAPEFNIVAPTPENWKQGFEKNNVDAVFIESAWHGNNNSWETLTTNFGGLNKLETLQNLLSTAKKNGIPTIFWNKEDPVHFKGFIDTAKMMDFVFTSDAECIPKYREVIGHRNIYALPFAAQHKIHNPVRDSSRNKTVSFAGSYYNFSFAERKLDLDILLMPAMDFGLEIYDRNFGATGRDAEEYKFPDLYRPAIKGKLDYNDMLKAYRAYKVFLNVNSVKYSTTMFARRVFELLACGTPVISNYSKGIVNLLGEDTVFITESESDTRKYLEKLLGDEGYWWRTSLHGMRKVMDHHTYEDRSQEIFSLTGQLFKKSGPLSLLVLAKISSPGEAKYLVELLRMQLLPPAGIVFVPDPAIRFSDKQVEEIMSVNAPVRMVLAGHFTDQSIRQAIAGFDFSHMVVFDPNHFYGMNYLRDASLAVKYSGAQILGKKESVSLSASGSLTIPELTSDYRWVDTVPAETLVISRMLLHGHDLCAMIVNPGFTSAKPDILSLDPFNFLSGGREIHRRDPIRVAEIIGI